MNILIDELPTELLVGEKSYPINTDFKTCLTIILAFEDEELTALEKQIILLTDLFVELPTDYEAAIKAGMKFLNGPIGETAEEGTGLRLYSFSKDANLIYAAFRQTHGVDLQLDNMHWWKFLALFMDLGQDTTFCNLITLRKRVKTGKASKEERAAARELGDAFVVSDLDTRTLEEREMERTFMESLGRGS